VDNFLFSAREGASLDFASSFVVLCRQGGIPARLVTGFALGDITEGKRAVRAAHYHAWAEVLFSDLGWVQLETSSVDNIKTPGGVGADGSDPTVGLVEIRDGNSSITMGASGGGTTENGTVKVNLTTQKATFGTQYQVRPQMIMKGQVFEVKGYISNPVDLKAGAALSVYMNSSDHLVGRGRSGPDGSFTVLCNADSLPVGEKTVGISFNVIRGTKLYTGITDNRTMERNKVLLCSNTTLGILSKDYAVSGREFSFSLSLKDAGGLFPPWPERMDVVWADHHNMSFESYGEEVKSFMVTEPPGRRNLTAAFCGSLFLYPSIAARNISVKSSGLKMDVSFFPEAPETGNQLFVEVVLTDEFNRRMAYNVSVLLDDVEMASGRAGTIMNMTLDPSRVGAGIHGLKAKFFGNDLYPELTREMDVHIKGRTYLNLISQNVSLGTSPEHTGYLTDNLNLPVVGVKVGLRWTDTLGKEMSEDKLTYGEGDFHFKISTNATMPPGEILVSARFEGDSNYLNSNVTAYFQLTSRSFINATVPKQLTRGEQFSFSGFLYDHLRRPIPRAAIGLHRGEVSWGLWRADDTGNFSMVCDVPGLEAAGPAVLNLSYAGEGFREPASIEFNVSIYTRTYINLTVPSGLQQGAEFDAVAVLTDDLGNPVVRDNLTVDFAGKRYTRGTDGFGRAVLRLRFPWFSTEEGIKAGYAGGVYKRPAAASLSLTAEPVIAYRLLAAVAIVASLVAGIYIYRRYGWGRGLEGLPAELRDRSWITDRYRRTIYKVYTRMLARMRDLGAPRRESLTVREYERELGGSIALDLRSLALLTITFEEARYSRHRFTSVDSRRAVVTYRKLMNSIVPPEVSEGQADAAGAGQGGEDGPKTVGPGKGGSGEWPGAGGQPMGALRNPG
jgi:hypothetical protein